MKECNIVKDLLPLYIEELCTEDSREYVEEHLKKCKECKESFEYLKYSELCVEAIEKNEISAFKKLERYISGRIMMNYFLFLVAVIIGVGVLFFTTAQVSEKVYYVLMPLTMLATGFTFYNVKFSKKECKVARVRFGLQGIVLVSSIFVIFYMMYAVGRDEVPFGIPVYETGPIMDAILRMNIIISLVIFIIYLYQVGRGIVRYSVWGNLPILSIFLCLVYDSFLYNMFDLQKAVEFLINNTVGFVVIFIVMSLTIWFCYERKQRR